MQMYILVLFISLARFFIKKKMESLKVNAAQNESLAFKFKFYVGIVFLIAFFFFEYAITSMVFYTINLIHLKDLEDWGSFDPYLE